MPGEQRRYGLLLPHFGAHASRETLLKFAQAAERYGFDSAWVRDHIVFHPHGMEGQDRTHIDPMITLSLVAGITNRLILGTGPRIHQRKASQVRWVRPRQGQRHGGGGNGLPRLDRAQRLTTDPDPGGQILLLCP